LSHSVCIFEDKRFSNFFPLSLSQPVFDLRVGFQTFRSRLEDEFPSETVQLLCRDYLAPLTKLRLPDRAVNEAPIGDTLFLNGRLLCFQGELKEVLDGLADNNIAVKGGYVVAARLQEKQAQAFAEYIGKRISEDTISQMCDELRDLSRGGEPPAQKAPPEIRSNRAEVGTYEDVHALGQDSVEEKVPVELSKLVKKHDIRIVEMPEARLLSFPWQMIEFNPDVITDDFHRLPFRGLSEESVIYPGVQLVVEENIVIGESVVIKPGAVLDASNGPIAIGDRSLIMPNVSIVGPVSIGNDNIIRTGAKILGGTSTGTVCRIGGEVEGTIVGSYSNKQHDGFIGHSYIGEWVNIGAASNNSDLKNNYSPVRMWNAGRMKSTGRQFMGLLMGDHTKTGINTLFNTGTVVGFNCNIFSAEMPDRFVPSYSWGHGAELTEYDLTKAMQTAEIVMERRKVKFDTAHREIFERIHELSSRCARNI